MQQLSLYHSELCFFCHKVRQAMSRLNVDVALRDVGEAQHRNDLAKGGGKTQVPCLKIENGSKVKWLYESDDIIRYLQSI
ncbi:MAG: glutathione S-transferase N-terminal domain-containing protein [Arenicella sp.]